MSDFTTTLQVTQFPEQAFQAINQVTAWWTQHLTGSSQNLGDAFSKKDNNKRWHHGFETEVPPIDATWKLNFYLN